MRLATGGSAVPASLTDLRSGKRSLAATITGWRNTSKPTFPRSGSANPQGEEDDRLRLRIAGVQHGLARRRHLRQRHRRFPLRGLRRGFGVQHAVAEPIGEIGGLAAFVLGLRRLALAV